MRETTSTEITGFVIKSLYLLIFQKRAVKAENTVAKLRQELVTLQVWCEFYFIF